MDLSKYKSVNNDNLLSEIDKLNNKNKFEDDSRIWYPKVDKAGNGNAIIRFLDCHPDEDVPFVQFHEHNFQGPTGLVYREYCSKDVNIPCPVCESNRVLWKTGEAGEKQVRESGQIRSHVFVSNIMILKYPDDTEQEGKIFLYRYGKQIFNKINEMMHPDQSLGEKEPINPFHFINGANFILRIRKVDKWRSYVTSTFESQSPLTKSDKEIERIVNSLYPLQPFVAPELYKDYETLKARYDKVMGLDGTPLREEREAAATSRRRKVVEDDDSSFVESSSDDDEDTNFFRNLAKTA